jgi:molybdopterin-containing oxidoreductase family iron-sulfur binding subunit
MSADASPGVPELDRAAVDAQLEEHRPDPETALSDVDYSTDLGTAMAEDATRVSAGELSSEAFWAKYDEAARQEFGAAYEETPNPAVDKGDGSQTIDAGAADQLSCSVDSMESVAAEFESADGLEDGKWGMVIDLQKCVGCDSCTVACKAENRTPPGVSYNVVMQEEHGEYPEVSRTNTPRPCMQCENPSCVQVCPVSATYKMENGVVNIDADRCIGCRYCMIACPYGARYFDFGESYDKEVQGAGEIQSPEYGVTKAERSDGEAPIGTVRKCSFCYHRLGRDEEPACVETCIGDARNFGDLEDPDSEVAQMADSDRAFQLKEHTGNDPNVYYLK